MQVNASDGGKTTTSHVFFFTFLPVLVMKPTIRSQQDRTMVTTIDGYRRICMDEAVQMRLFWAKLSK